MPCFVFGEIVIFSKMLLYSHLYESRDAFAFGLTVIRSVRKHALSVSKGPCDREERPASSAIGAAGSEIRGGS